LSDTEVNKAGILGVGINTFYECVVVLLELGNLDLVVVTTNFDVSALCRISKDIILYLIQGKITTGRRVISLDFCCAIPKGLVEH
jgi:hypothetical protein